MDAAVAPLKGLKSFFRRRRKMFYRLSTGGGLALVTAIAIILLLPSFLSTRTAQDFLRNRLQAALQRPVDWRDLQLSWREGMRLEGLSLGAGPAPIPNLYFEQLTASFGVSRSESRPLLVIFKLHLSGLTAEFETAAASGDVQAAATAEASPEEMLAEMAAKLQEVLALGWDLPVDVQAMVEIGPAAFRYRNAGSGETAGIEDFRFTLAVPSLVKEPVTVATSGALTLKDQPMGTLRQSAQIGPLVAADGRLRPAQAPVEASLDFPGTRGTLQGALAGTGLTGTLLIHPAKLLPVLRPMLPSSLPQVAGTVSATVHGEVLAAGDLRLDIGVQGEEISAEGGSLDRRHFGPVSFSFSQRIVTDQARDAVVVENGALLSPGLLDARWRGKVVHPTSPRRRLDAHIGPVAIDLDRLLSLAGPWLPADLPLTRLAGRFECDALAVMAENAGRDGKIDLRGLRLRLDQVEARVAIGEMAARRVQLQLDAAEVPLVAGFPTSATLHLGWQLAGLELKGGQPLALGDFAGQATVTISDLRQEAKSPFGVAARLALEQELSLAALRLPGTLDLAGVRERLRIGLVAAPDGELQFALGQLEVALADTRPFFQGRQLPTLPIALTIEEAMAILPPGQSLPHRAAARLRLQAGDWLHLRMHTGIDPAADPIFRSEGHLALDAAHLAAWAKTLLPKDGDGEGMIDLDWRLAARLPAGGLPPLSGPPLQQARDALDLLTEADLKLNLRQVGIALPGKEGLLHISGIDSPRPWHLFAKGSQTAAFDLQLDIERLSGLPGAGDLPPQRIRFALQGEQRDLRSARVTEEVRVEPAGVAQVAEVVVEKLDRLGDLTAPTPADLLRRLNATVFATLDLNLPAALATVQPALSLGGELSAALRLDLEGGKELRVGVFGEAADLALRQEKGPEAEGLNLRLAFNRRYRIGEVQQEAAAAPWLSEAVLGGGRRARPSAAPLVTERLWQDLRGGDGRERSVTFRRAKATVAGFPLELRDGEALVQLDGRNPGLGYLQTGLLGGNLKARAVLDLTPETPVAELRCAFSHLDISRLLPAGVREEHGADSEVTGEMSLLLPLLEDHRQLLEKLEMRLHLWRVGSRTLERALFALDPYEQNEAVIEQRKMLRLGSLKQLRFAAADGSLSSEGEIEIKGVGIALPRIDRLNLAALSLEEQLAEPLRTLPELLRLLELAAADSLIIDDQDQISLRRRQTGEAMP